MAQGTLPPIHGNTWHDALRGIVIQSKVAAPPGRKDFEKQFFPGIEVGLPGWQRAHSQGSGTGFESPHAIRYAPEEVNQEFQRLGIERFIRELYAEKAPDVELYLTTTTYTHPRSLRLAEITYRVDAERAGRRRPLFEVAIEVENRRDDPRVTITGTPRLPRDQWEQYLRTPSR